MTDRDSRPLHNYKITKFPLLCPIIYSIDLSKLSQTSSPSQNSVNLFLAPQSPFHPSPTSHTFHIVLLRFSFEDIALSVTLVTLNQSLSPEQSSVYDVQW